MQYDTCIGECGKNIEYWSPGHQACFTMIVFHLDIKGHVVFDKLESMWNTPPEHQMQYRHFSCLVQWHLPIGWIQCIGLLLMHHPLTLGQEDQTCEFFEVLHVTTFHQWDDNILCLEDTKNPPVETFFKIFAPMYCKLSILDRLRFFDVREPFQVSGAILPSATDQLTLCWLTLVGRATDNDLLLI